MSPQLALIKLRLRLNKLHSSDYDNIEDWKGIEAINKAQLEWYRRQVQGYNRRQQGAEEDRVNVDDLQQFIVERKLSGVNKKQFFLSTDLPVDYLWYKKLIPLCKKGGCQGIAVESILTEEANVATYLFDWSMQPSFEWRETFHTLVGGKIRIYTDDKFEVENILLTYYRVPQKIDIAGYTHEDGKASKDSDLEFKDDVAEIILDEAASILAADTEYFTGMQAIKARGTENS